MVASARCTGFSYRGQEHWLIPCQLIQVENHIHSWSLVFLSQDLLWQLTPTGSNVQLYQLHSSLLNEGVNQWEDLWSETHPTGLPCSPFCDLTHVLQGKQLFLLFMQDAFAGSLVPRCALVWGMVVRGFVRRDLC